MDELKTKLSTLFKFNILGILQNGFIETFFLQNITSCGF